MRKTATAEPHRQFEFPVPIRLRNLNMTKRPLFAAIGLVCLLAGCSTTGGVAPPPPASFGYAYVWGGAPPEPYYSNAVRLLEAGTVQVLRTSIDRVELACGRNRTDYGWFGAACMMTGNATGTHFVVIAQEITDPAAIRNIMVHEIAHTRQAGGWSGDHPGAMKPLGHLDNCIRTMNAEGLTVRQMGLLCNLYSGAPLRTQAERDRWAAMR
jgi:hypothetical protein